MEMGLSQADAARRLNVSRSVVHVRPRATTSAGDRFITLSAGRRRKVSVPHLVADNSVASAKRISDGTENTLPVPDSDGLLYSKQTSPDSDWRAIHDICLSGGNEAPDIINPTLLNDTVTEVVEQWVGQGSHSLVTLTCMCSREEL
ncbi:paired domain-containing protein [Trichonephila clavipes]|nr:paired domain-containing protein [Trichonephila clavipes]